MGCGSYNDDKYVTLDKEKISLIELGCQPILDLMLPVYAKMLPYGYCRSISWTTFFVRKF